MRIRGSVFLKGKGGKPGGEYTGRSNNYKVSADLLRLLATPTESPPQFSKFDLKSGRRTR